MAAEVIQIRGPGSRAASARDKILEVAEQLIVKYGSNGFSYQHVADAVGIRKASIHHHFPAKADLILALGATKSAQFFDDLEAIVAREPDAVARLRGYFALFEENFIHGCGASISLFGMLGAEIESQDDRVAERVRSFFNENIRRLSAIIRQGAEDGSLRATDEPELVAAAIFSMLEGAMIVLRASDEPERYGAIIKHALRLIAAEGA